MENIKSSFQDMKSFASGTDASTTCRTTLGCWGDKGSPPSARAISGGNRLPQHKSDYEDNIRDLVKDCYNFAKSQGWTVFAVQNQNECYTSADAENTYQKHGKVDRCSNGKGGFNALDVYKIETCQGIQSFPENKLGLI